MWAAGEYTDVGHEKKKMLDILPMGCGTTHSGAHSRAAFRCSTYIIVSCTLHSTGQDVSRRSESRSRMRAAAGGSLKINGHTQSRS